MQSKEKAEIDLHRGFSLGRETEYSRKGYIILYYNIISPIRRDNIKKY